MVYWILCYFGGMLLCGLMVLTVLFCFQNVKQVVKDLLERTDFNKLCYFEQKFDNFGDDEQEPWHYYIVEFEAYGSNSFGHLRIIVDLDPEILSQEVVEEGDDALSVPAKGYFKFQDLGLG
jgi:hypothetical protein